MRISPPLEGRGRGGVFDPKVILAFFQHDVFSALGVVTVSWRMLFIKFQPHLEKIPTHPMATKGD